MALEEEGKAVREVWREFRGRVRRSKIVRVMLAQIVLAVGLLITYLFQPYWYRYDLSPAPIYHLFVLAFYIFWPNVPDKVVKYKIPIVVHIVVLLFYIPNLVQAVDRTIHLFHWGVVGPVSLITLAIMIAIFILQAVVILAAIRDFLLRAYPTIQLE